MYGVKYLVGGLEHFLFFHILGRSSQLLLTHIFQRGRSTTKQCMFDGFDTSFHPDEYHVKCPGKWVENHFILCTALVVKCIKNNGEKK